MMCHFYNPGMYVKGQSHSQGQVENQFSKHNFHIWIVIK